MKKNIEKWIVSPYMEEWIVTDNLKNVQGIAEFVSLFLKVWTSVSLFFASLYQFIQLWNWNYFLFSWAQVISDSAILILLFWPIGYIVVMFYFIIRQYKALSKIKKIDDIELVKLIKNYKQKQDSFYKEAEGNLSIQIKRTRKLFWETCYKLIFWDIKIKKYNIELIKLFLSLIQHKFKLISNKAYLNYLLISNHPIFKRMFYHILLSIFIIIYSWSMIFPIFYDWYIKNLKNWWLETNICYSSNWTSYYLGWVRLYFNDRWALIRENNNNTFYLPIWSVNKISANEFKTECKK